MTIHVSVDTGCNMGCTYCYEEPDREINENNLKNDYDVDLMIEQLEEWKEKYPNSPPGLHGGEPLLLKDEDIERIFKWVYDNYEVVSSGRKFTHIQTNGTLIKDHHIEMFNKYNVGVGISCDGPEELNDERLARKGGKDVTDEFTKLTHQAIWDCLDAGCSVGIITVTHQENAGDDEKIDKLLDWMDKLNRNGATGHFNPAIPYDDVQTELSLEPEQLKHLYLRTWEWMKEESYRTWDPMRWFQDNLLGLDLGNCVNDKCDIFNAGAAKIVNGQGETTGCGKTWPAVGDGVPFLQGPSNNSEYDSSNERYEMLKQVPTEEGGCKGCDYWNVCQGGCPSAAINQDFRNRTRWCEAKYALYEKIEQDMRSMFPNITLITDLPWDAQIADLSTHWQLDVGPFSNMDPTTGRPSSVYGNYRNNRGQVEDRVPEEVLPERTNEEVLEEYIEEHGEDVVTHHQDGEEFNIHADSEISGWEKVDD